MKRYELITIILCCVTLIAPAQNKRTVKTTNSTPRTTNSQNKSTQTAPKTREIPINSPLLLSTQELENQRKEALKEIELTSRLLSEINVSAKTSLSKLNLLSTQLQNRKKVIAILGQELAAIDKNIKTMSNDIEILDKDLAKTKDNYAKSMQNQQQEYRTTQYKMLMILSAENLSQSYRRMRYLREYANWQKNESNRIIQKQSEIIHRKAELEKTRQEKQNLLAQRENENNNLAAEEKQQQSEMRTLNNKQKDLQRLIDQKRKEADALNKQIEILIAEEIAEKNKPAVTTETKAPEKTTSGVSSSNATSSGKTSSGTASSGKTSPENASSGKTSPGNVPSGKTSSDIASSGVASSGKTSSDASSSVAASSGNTASTTVSSATVSSSKTASSENASKATETSPSPAKDAYVSLESESTLTKNFTNSKGKLPSPLTGKYTIISSFGEHQHQELSYVRTNNNGIDIQTTAGSEACAIFKGIVTRVFVMPGYNNNVIIRHGDYLTVYSNLSNVYVKAGDVVTARQTIGKIFTDTEKGNETILHFQIWKERTKLNPSVWIR